MLKQLLLQLILIFLKAFFAATEIAVISINEKKVRAQAEEGDKKAAKMLKIIEEPTRFLSTIQIGITLAGFLGSFLFHPYFGRACSQKNCNEAQGKACERRLRHYFVFSGGIKSDNLVFDRFNKRGFAAYRH